MIHTEGLTHIHFAVSDLDRSLRFYQQAFGMRELFRVEPDMVFLQTPARMHRTPSLCMPTLATRGTGRVEGSPTSASP